MADILRIKRRAAGGAAGAPAALANAELAYNEQDDTLYYGKGGTPAAAASVVPVAGSGTFATKSSLGSSQWDMGLVALDTSQPDPVEELRAQIADLTARIAALEARQ